MLKPKIAAWRDLSETPFRSLLLGGGSPGSLGHFRLHLWQEYHPVFTLNGCVSVIPTDPAFFHLEVQSRGSADRPPAFFAGLQRCLPLAGVTSAFLFHLCITWNAVDWEALFGGMPELDELALRYEIVDGTEAMRSLDTSVHCPRLKTLSVEEVYTRSPDGGHRGAEALAPAAVTLAHVGLSLVKEERRGCMMAVRKHGRMFKPREPAVTRRSLLSTLLRRGGR
ncbi:hypothetical protein PsYK624_053900 [Phanerochaete sordida]|uniref:Uncharacterized protein n=1 Tax=Phanerochaete sordida TaxID=48140 RepID=A0A9P3LCK0_9APHY|nr:hypothetical protein PsYK624_053900 [Phanerochaete sordida]